MSCNCKNESTIDNFLNDKDVKITFNFKSIIFYSLKILAFLLLIILLPILNVYIIWLMFNMLVLNKNTDIKPLLVALGNKFKEKEDEEDEISDEEYDNLTEEDVILLDSEEINNNKEVNNV